ncbi:hypothetical protein L2E82_18133 [Cichorium intybus]|uniref:Uncharacterized protein n=1 Tax=Cichorium intybus TaxID=13427 RepID=A0ACB9FA88_CICIN|nr:hypothetical protein L2E82_18133 [Cichorium intybus]
MLFSTKTEPVKKLPGGNVKKKIKLVIEELDEKKKETLKVTWVKVNSPPIKQILQKEVETKLKEAAVISMGTEETQMEKPIDPTSVYKHNRKNSY